MRLPTVLALALTGVMVLAGCAGKSGGGGEAGNGADGGAGGGALGEGDAATSILAPDWQVGDAWTLSSPQQDSGPFTHAVSGEAGDDWIVDTDSRDTAYFDARFDVSFLGKVRKSDLAGSQGSTRVEFLRFPLSQGLNWTTMWDGERMTVQATQVTEGKATLQARRADGTLYAEYVYDSKPAYFTRFAFYAPDGTTIGFEWSLQQAAKGFSGTLVRWTLAELYQASGPIPQAQSGTFNVAPGFTDVWIDGALDCSSGAVVFAAGPPTGPTEDRGYSQVGPCPLVANDAYAVAAPTEAEQWGAILTSAPLTQGTLELTIFGRTITEFQAGQAPP